MSVSEKSFPSEDDYEHKEDGTSNSDGEGGTVPGPSEVDHHPAEEESSSVVREEIGNKVAKPLSDESITSIDDEDSRLVSKEDKPQNIGGVDQQEVKSGISISEVSDESIESSELYSSYTAGGGYNPDEEQLSASEPNISESSQDNDNILGDTQPVKLSPGKSSKRLPQI